MVSKVLNAPINLYFDVTPIGRILNRFSKDLSQIESNMSYNIGGLFAMSYQSLAVVIVSCISVYWIALVFPVMVYLSYKLYTASI